MEVVTCERIYIGLEYRKFGLGVQIKFQKLGSVQNGTVIGPTQPTGYFFLSRQSCKQQRNLKIHGGRAWTRINQSPSENTRNADVLDIDKRRRRSTVQRDTFQWRMTRQRYTTESELNFLSRLASNPRLKPPSKPFTTRLVVPLTILQKNPPPPKPTTSLLSPPPPKPGSPPSAPPKTLNLTLILNLALQTMRMGMAMS